MKNVILFLIAVIFIFNNSNGQTVENDSDFITKRYRLNFAIPDHPAFNLLTTQPSEILRPSNIKALSAMVSNFNNGSSFTIPKSLGLEISPLLLVNNKLKPSDYYRNNTWLKTMESIRISIGTELDASNKSARSMALGFRISLENDKEINDDPYYQTLVSQSLRKRINLRKKLENDYLIENKLIESALTDEDLARRELYISKELEIQLAKESKNLKTEISTYRETFKAANWNNKRWDLAVACKYKSPDSLAKNARVTNFSFWSTWASPVGKYGQILYGTNVSLLRKDTLDKDNTFRFVKKYVEISFPLRIYLGKNEFKGYFELQYKFIESAGTNNLWYNLGAEVSLRDGIWVVFSAGYRKDLTTNTSDLISNFSLRYTIPEKF